MQTLERIRKETGVSCELPKIKEGSNFERQKIKLDEEIKLFRKVLHFFSFVLLAEIVLETEQKDSKSRVICMFWNLFQFNL